MLIYNIGRLLGLDPDGSLRSRRGREMDFVAALGPGVWMEIDPESGKITAIGASGAREPREGDLDARGAWVFPSFCDSHTHIIYAGSREG